MNNEILQRLKWLNTKSSLDPLPGDTEAYLEVPDSQKVSMPGQETVWVKISEAGELEIIRWDIIEKYAAQYDADKNARDQTRVISKLLMLVREQTRKEMRHE